MRQHFYAACLLSAALLPGCVASKIDAGNALGASRPAAEPFEASAAYPETGWRLIFTKLAGAGPATIAIEWSGAPGEAALERFDPALSGDAGAFLSQSVARSEAGDLLSTRTVTTERSVITDYTPHLLVEPGLLAPGEPVAHELELIVHPLSRPDRVQNRGAATQTFELVGTQRVRTPAGDFDATRVRETFEARVSLATIKRVTDQWFAPGVGLVAEMVEETIRALGVPVSGFSEMYVLEAIETPAQGARGGRASADMIGHAHGTHRELPR